MIREVRVDAQPINPAQEMARLDATGAGAIASFAGLVRGDGGLVAMTLDHYPAMTALALNALADEAVTRWPLSGIVVVHRVGRMRPGEPIVIVATASAHRAAALEACAFLIDRLKTDAPFWKKEEWEGGKSRWVEARASDDAAADRWRA